jgi:predicted ester cyclase
VGGRQILFCAHLMTPEVQATVAQRFPDFDLAILAINGLCLRVRGNHQLSFLPDDAAGLLNRLHVRVGVPIHYAFHGGLASRAVLLSHAGTPEGLGDAVRRLAPEATAMALAPGQLLTLASGSSLVEGTAEGRKRASILAFFARLNAGDLDAFDLFAADFLHHHPLPTAPDGSREGARLGLIRLREVIRDFHVEVEHVIVEGDAVLVRIVQSGTLTRAVLGLAHPAGPMKTRTTLLYRFQHDHVAEEWIDGGVMSPVHTA